MSDINSGLLNDVLIVGNELSGKLNEIGVSNTFGKASEGKDDLISLIRMAIDGIDMAVDTNSYISLTATNPYMLTGETTDIVAKLRNGVCRPLTNKNVTIEQSVFIDDGITTSHNDNWTLTSNMQRTRNDSYTTLSNIGSSSQMAYPISNTTKFSGDIIIEWDNWATEYQLNYFIVAGSSDVAKAFGALYINKACHVKITIIGTTMKCYIDGVDKATYIINRDANNQFQVRLQINPNGNDIKYSNFKVYQIINGVTNENGEFALNDVSVTDDTTFIANYETVSDSCLVEYCKFVDYGVTSNHNDSWDGLTYMSRETDGTTINNTGSGTLFERIKINNSTFPFSNGDFTVTLNILDINGSDNRLRLIGETTCSGEPYAQVDYTLLSTSIGEFKMVYDSTNHTIKVYKDGTLLATTNRALCGNLTFMFRVTAGSSIKYKDLRIKAL